MHYNHAFPTLAFLLGQSIMWSRLPSGLQCSILSPVLYSNLASLLYHAVTFRFSFIMLCALSVSLPPTCRVSLLALLPMCASWISFSILLLHFHLSCAVSISLPSLLSPFHPVISPSCIHFSTLLWSTPAPLPLLPSPFHTVICPYCDPFFTLLLVLF